MDEDEDELSAALAGLSRVVSAHRTLEGTLTRIAEFAVQAIPHADGAGLTLHNGDQRQTVVSSAAFVRNIDDVQYSLDEGPCITAIRELRTVMSGSLGGDPQWPRFGPRVSRLGIHSALSLPLVLDEGTEEPEAVGVLNVYAHEKNAFDKQSARFGEAFALPAAVSVFNARTLTDMSRTVGQLREALSSRASIDQAVGLVMSRSGASADEAMERLREMSRRGNVKLAVVAQQLLDEAVARARARMGQRGDG